MRLPRSVVLRVALAAIASLIAVSIALPFADAGPSRAVGWTLLKVGVLAFVAVRVVRQDVYALQWSSMLVLLFVAEGVVRAMTDPEVTAGLGVLAACAGTAYFIAVLAWLRPLKKAARAASP